MIGRAKSIIGKLIILSLYAIGITTVLIKGTTTIGGLVFGLAIGSLLVFFLLFVVFDIVLNIEPEAIVYWLFIAIFVFFLPWFAMPGEGNIMIIEDGKGNERIVRGFSLVATPHNKEFTIYGDFKSKKNFQLQDIEMNASVNISKNGLKDLTNWLQTREDKSVALSELRNKLNDFELSFQGEGEN